MSTSGMLVNTFGWLVGTGPGSGFGLLILLCGVGGTLVGLAGYLTPSIRNVDHLLPDFRRLPPVGMIRRASVPRIRLSARKVRKVNRRVLRGRTPWPPAKS
jgi:hypothetical protein